MKASTGETQALIQWLMSAFQPLVSKRMQRFNACNSVHFMPKFRHVSTENSKGWTNLTHNL